MTNATPTATPVRRRYPKPPKDFSPMDGRVNYVYRLYDNEGVAIYIGRSVNPLARLKSHHASGADWAKQVVGIDAWGPFDWDTVVRLEREAITKDRPIGNKEFVINKTYIAPVLP